MKKFFYSMLAAVMLFATSCSENELVDVTKGEGEKVTFMVELPGIESRAIDAENNTFGSGKYATRLVYAMYEEDKDDVLITDFADRDDETGTFTVTVPMAKDIKYDLLFLAYHPANCAFNINNSDARANNLKALQLKPNLNENKVPNLKANTEEYDAFVGHLESQGITASGTTTVELKRPFAQVNVGTIRQDLDDIETLQSIVVTSDFKIYNAPNTLNILTDEVSGNETRSYAVENIWKQYGNNTYPNYETIEGVTAAVTTDDKNYYCLAMSYVLAGKNSPTTHDADFRFYRADGKQVSSINVLSMPIQANYRTNILGTILTQIEQYEVTIKPIFAQEDHEAEPVLPQQSNEIWYTATALVHAHFYKDKFGAGTDLVSNVWEETTGKGIITLNGPVTVIGINAFYDCEHLISISIPNSVTEIEEDAFDSCPNLTNVTFSNNLVTIGKGAFGGCSKLANVIIPESVTTIQQMVGRNLCAGFIIGSLPRSVGCYC